MQPHNLQVWECILLQVRLLMEQRDSWRLQPRRGHLGFYFLSVFVSLVILFVVLFHLLQ
ncbi:unnamed protein product [Brassica rapa subsp. trilocularis]